jgi:hypothetical protein
MEPAVGESVEVGASARESSSELIESDIVETREWYNQPKHLWLLSFAGKPVYSRHGDESLLSSKMGMLAGIIGIVIDTKDSLQFFVAGDYKFVFLVRGPIYLVLASRTHEPVMLLRAQLDYACEFCSSASIPTALLTPLLPLLLLLSTN